MTATPQGKRLQLAREHAGYKSGRQAALRLGWKYPTYAAHESGWRTYPPRVAKKYSKAFGVSEEWLLFGKGAPEWYTLNAPEIFEVESPVRYMPMFNSEDASAIEQVMHAEVLRRDFSITDMGDLPPHCFAVQVYTDEMESDIRRGEILIFHLSKEEPAPGSIVILHVKRQSKPSIRKVKSGAGGLRYVASNDDYEPLDNMDCKVFGRAVMRIHKM